MKDEGGAELWFDRPLKCPHCRPSWTVRTATPTGNAAEPGSLVICDLCLMPSVLTESLDLAVPARRPGADRGGPGWARSGAPADQATDQAGAELTWSGGLSARGGGVSSSYASAEQPTVGRLE